MGILFGSALAGIGKGLGAYNDLEEKKRAEQVQTDIAYGKMDYAETLKEEAKAKEEAKKKERQEAFKADSAAWRKDHPDATPTDFIVHFSDTEHADLLAPMISAAKIMNEAEVHKAQLKHYELQAAELEARGKREEAAAKRDAAAHARAAAESSERRTLAQTKAARETEEWEEKKRAKGLLAGLEEAKSQNLPAAEEKYKSELTKMGLKPKEEIQYKEREIESVDDKGNKIKETYKVALPHGAPEIPPNFVPLEERVGGPESSQIFENPMTHEKKALNTKTNEWETIVPNPKKAKAAAAPETPGAPAKPAVVAQAEASTKPSYEKWMAAKNALAAVEKKAEDMSPSARESYLASRVPELKEEIARNAKYYLNQ